MRTHPSEQGLGFRVVYPNGRSLSAGFALQKDRYAHSISFTDGDESVELLTSLEGSEGDPCPPSPALQGLNVDDLRAANGKAEATALMIGMVGDSHWSVSIGSGGESDSTGIVYDAACRMKKLTAELRATYKAPGATVLDRGKQSVTLKTAGVTWRVTVIAADGARPGFCRLESPDRNEWFGKPKIAVVCEPAMNDEPPITLRWRHLVELVD